MKSLTLDEFSAELAAGHVICAGWAQVFGPGAGSKELGNFIPVV